MLSLTSPVETIWHRWSAAPKLGGLLVFTFLVFWLDSVPGQVGAVALVVLLYLVGGKGFLPEGLARLRPLIPFVVIVMAWHVFTGDWAGGAIFVLRLVAVVALANLVTMTTRLSDMIDLVMRVLAPLRRVGVPVGAIGLAIAMVIRFTPRMIGLHARIQEAWRARSPRRPAWRIAVPITLAALDDAEQVAEALRARGGVPEEKHHGT